MTGKWVDNEVYFGPDRRKRDGAKRWQERRRLNDAAEPPPPGALLRRLRVLILDKSPSARQRSMLLARLAITEAEKLRWLQCADKIKEAQRFINAGDPAGADALIVDAMTLASAGQ
jgi:hypothetical protein